MNSRIMNSRIGIQAMTALAVGMFILLALSAGSVSAGIHTWDVNEVFTNGDGSIQFVELRENGAPPGNETGVTGGAISSLTQTYAIVPEGPVVAPTAGKHYLIATQAFADLPGAPAPDAIISPANIPFFTAASDTVAFGGFDSLVVTSAPTNGTDSFGAGGVIALNSPTNYAGATGSVDAFVPTAAPALSAPAIMALVSLMVLAGGYMVRRRFAPTD